MASKLRAEFVRMRTQDANGPQGQLYYSDQAPVTKAVSGTALTGAGRITVPAAVNGYTSFHVRLISDVETLISIAPPADAGTAFDVTAARVGSIAIEANRAYLLPVGPNGILPGSLISAATGLSFA